VKQRDKVAMTAAEVAEFLAGSHKLQLATINPDGTPHLVTMFYVMLGGRIAFWTYRASQKALNLSRDPRLTCLVESGEDYFDLRGVQVAGVARLVDDLAGVTEIGRGVAAGMTGMPADSAEDYVAHSARKRVGFIVEPVRIISWNHSKLLQPPSA
jgi:PPOX class probable F420-dependent enzyme